MFQVLTINIAFEIFGMVFCIICIAISILSPIGTGRHAAVAAYQGVYMEQYSWAEVTNSALYWNRAQDQ